MKLSLPNGFNPPTKVVRSKYVLETLSPKHNEMDYEAWSSSEKDLKGIFGPHDNWPESVTSLEQNLSDLENHYREFVERIAYAYTILNPDETQCIGCLYIRPTPATAYDCRVDFWFRNSSKSLEDEFFIELESWLKKDWKLVSVAYPGRRIPWDEYKFPVRYVVNPSR